MRHYILFILLVLCTGVYAQADRQYIREGNRMYRQKDFAKAEIMYRKAAAANSSNPQALYNLGCALMMQQKDSAAIVQYQNAARVEKSKSRQAKIYHNMGVICQKHQMYDDAIKAYEQSLRCNPADNETRYNLALCKKLRKNQPQQNKKDDKNQQKDKDKNGKDDKKEKDDKENNKDKNDEKQQSKEQMNKENAEQLLEAAIQDEKATQQKLKKAMQQPRSRNIQKNW